MTRPNNPPQPRPLTEHERHLIARYDQDTPIGWFTSTMQRHAYLGPAGRIDDTINTLCGSNVERLDPGVRRSDFATCQQCWTTAVLIRCRRPPATTI